MTNIKDSIRYKHKQKTGVKRMRQRNNNLVKSECARLMDTEELRAYTCLGRNSAIKLGEEIGARVQIGRRVLWDRVKIDQYFNSLVGVK